MQKKLTPLLTHWIYVFLALTHWDLLMMRHRCILYSVAGIQTYHAHRGGRIEGAHVWAQQRLRVNLWHAFRIGDDRHPNLLQDFRNISLDWTCIKEKKMNRWLSARLQCRTGDTVFFALSHRNLFWNPFHERCFYRNLNSTGWKFHYAVPQVVMSLRYTV